MSSSSLLHRGACAVASSPATLTGRVFKKRRGGKMVDSQDVHGWAEVKLIEAWENDPPTTRSEVFRSSVTGGWISRELYDAERAQLAANANGRLFTNRKSFRLAVVGLNSLAYLQLTPGKRVLVQLKKVDDRVAY
jgi:hypothetical protein